MTQTRDPLSPRRTGGADFPRPALLKTLASGEDPAEYDALRAQLVNEYDPATEREAMLVEVIAQNYWRLKRARRVETQVFAKFGEMQCILDPEGNKAFRTITRYLNSIERSWRAACADLERLQDIRRAEEIQQAQNALVRMAARRPAPPIGSVSQPPTSLASPEPTVGPQGAGTVDSVIAVGYK